MNNFCTRLQCFLFIFLLVVLLLGAGFCETKRVSDVEKGPLPLMFKDYPQDPRRVKIMWNPAVNVSHIMEIAQRGVDYVLEPNEGVQPKTHDWLTLVTEEDHHDSTKRYVVLKEKPCSELQFRVSYRTANGEMHKDVLQKLKASPEPWNMSVSFRLQKLYFNKTDSRAYAKVDYKVLSTNYPGVDDVKPMLHMISCSTIFPGHHQQPPEPEVLDNGNTLAFDRTYVKHGCSFMLKVGFSVFSKDSECFSLLTNAVDQSLTIDLNCSKLGRPELDVCPPPVKQPCNADCHPIAIGVAPTYQYINGSAIMYARVSWQFVTPPAPTGGGGFLVRYTSIYNFYHNMIADDDSQPTIRYIEEPWLDLNPFSKQSEAIYAVQVCATTQKPCRTADIDWSTVEQYPIEFAEFNFAQRPPPASPIELLTTTTDAPPTSSFLTTQTPLLSFPTSLKPHKHATKNSFSTVSATSSAPLLGEEQKEGDEPKKNNHEAVNDAITSGSGILLANTSTTTSSSDTIIVSVSTSALPEKPVFSRKPAMTATPLSKIHHFKATSVIFENSRTTTRNRIQKPFESETSQKLQSSIFQTLPVSTLTPFRNAAALESSQNNNNGSQSSAALSSNRQQHGESSEISNPTSTSSSTRSEETIKRIKSSKFASRNNAASVVASGCFNYCLSIVCCLLPFLLHQIDCWKRLW